MTNMITSVKKFISVSIFAIAIFLGFCFPVFCSAEEAVQKLSEKQLVATIDENTYLGSLINQARNNPLAMASLLGKDPAQILKDFPDKRLILTHGLPVAAYNNKLAAAAGRHSRDMIENQYFAYDSRDGREPGDRIAAEGYKAQICGETLGMIGFYNLISPEEGVWKLFSRMFAEELDPQKEAPWVILNPALSEVGVSVAKGSFKIGSQAFNSYIGVCDFASSATDRMAAERKLLHLINKIRIQPEESLEIADTSFSQVVKTVGRENAWKFFLGLPPLAWNLELSNASRQVLNEMMDKAEKTESVLPAENFGVNHFYMDNVNSKNFSDIEGISKEKITAVHLAFYDENSETDPLQAATRLFENFLIGVFSEKHQELNDIIFNDKITELGLSFDCTASENGRVWTAIIAGCEPEVEKLWIVGQLDFLDLSEPETPMDALQSDDAEISTADEKRLSGIEVANCQILVTEVEADADDHADEVDVHETTSGTCDEVTGSISRVIYTDPLGGFQFDFEQGKSYVLQILAADGQIIYEDHFVSFQNRNKQKIIYLNKINHGQ